MCDGVGEAYELRIVCADAAHFDLPCVTTSVRARGGLPEREQPDSRVPYPTRTNPSQSPCKPSPHSADSIFSGGVGPHATTISSMIDRIMRSRGAHLKAGVVALRHRVPTCVSALSNLPVSCLNTFQTVRVSTGGEIKLALLYWQARTYRIFRSHRHKRRRHRCEPHESFSSAQNVHEFIGRVDRVWRRMSPPIFNRSSRGAA